MNPRIKFWSQTFSFLFLFALLLQIGFWFATKKPLWNDEMFTQFQSLTHSYKDLFLGRIGEGNISPLFYASQKFLCEITHSDATKRLEQEVGVGKNFPWYVHEGYSQIFLRITSIFFMSLAISLIFYFFMRFYSVWAGLYSLLLSVSSFMVWIYWAEARPYTQWFFLTTTQSLLFLYLTELGINNAHTNSSTSGGTRAWRWLVVNHLLLSFSSIFSIIQIITVSLLLWILLEKDWRRYITLTVIPSVVCIIYYIWSPKYRFTFNDTPWQLINANIPKDRLVIIILFALFLFFDYFLLNFCQLREHLLDLRRGPLILRNSIMWIQRPPRKKNLSGGPYLALTVLMLLAAGIVLWKFKLEEPSDHKGFAISNRYFLYLTPVGIIATTLFSVYIFRFLTKKIWLQILFVIVLALLSVSRIDRTYKLVKSYYQFK